MANRDGETLADRVLQSTYRDPKDFAVMAKKPERVRAAMMQYRTWMKQANRFSLDHTMIDQIVPIVVDDDKAQNNLHLARLPFPIVWVEYDQKYFYKRMMETGALVENPTKFDNVPERAGILCVRDPAKETRYIAFKFDNDSAFSKQTEVDSVAIAIDTDEPIGTNATILGLPTIATGIFSHISPDNKKIRGIPELIRKTESHQYLFPAGFHGEDEQFRKKFPWVHQNVCMVESIMFSNIRTASDLFDIDEKAGAKAYELMAETMSRSMYEQRGHARMITTIFALINHVPMIMEPRPAKTGYRTMGMNKVHFMSFSNIILKVPKTNPQRYVEKHLNAGIRHRAHQVRGHWAHSHRIGNANCEHVWININASREECTKCGKLRWWRKEHMRGDSSLGYVNQHYHVEGKR